MLKGIKKIWGIILVILSPLIVEAQEDYIVNQIKFLQKSNASFFGMNQLIELGSFLTLLN